MDRAGHKSVCVFVCGKMKFPNTPVDMCSKPERENRNHVNGCLVRGAGIMDAPSFSPTLCKVVLLSL